ncbi:unnamed protein product [Adineta steineri]|uniref:Uncharacterized protein n=1 Tax=Adineta steineri TaxID=433720 RepID=A0A814X9J9_9BILA|nr:unnamed protein product [Adineta steineri]CAF4007669.1 unnamed protein product [Adineta steineri]
MMNLELLFEVSNQTKDQYLYDIAWQHANRTMHEHFRDDNSIYGVIEYNETDGNVIRKYTIQGYADWSTWFRGQSWAIFGFIIAYRYTKYQPFLDKAIGATNYVLSHLLNPNDLILFWDYDAPNSSKLSALLANRTICPYPKNLYDVSLSFGDYYLTQAIMHLMKL